ncbi:MAG: PilN domain-containing protein [Methylotenera sp.]
MQPLRLDYTDYKNLRKQFGYVLLGMTLLLAANIAWYFNNLRQEATHIEDKKSRLALRVKSQVSTSEISQLTPDKLAEVIKFSNRAIYQLNLPWDILFTQLEAAKSEGVALLGIEPNAQNKAIKVEGEAKDYAAMLKYVRTLSEQGVLQSVYLTEHKMDDQNPDKPIHFTLEASWAEK